MRQQLQMHLLHAIICLTSVLFNLSYSQSVVCRLSRVEGFDNEYSTGHDVCGKTTNRMSNTKIYLTVKDDYLYAHSNYITSGFEYPTKLATNEPMNSAEEIAMNIFFARYPSEPRISEMNLMLRRDIDIIIDPKLLNSGKYGSIDFNRVGKVKILCPDGEIREAIKIRNADESIEFGVKYNNQFSTRIKGQNLNFIFTELRNRKIDFNDIRIINLVENSSTKEVLSSKFGLKKVDFDYSSVDDFKKLLLANKGKRTVILGHIEEGDFVTLRSGQEVFRVSISEIQLFQKENKLELIILGCNSANAGAGSGALNKFNSIDALNRLKTTEKTQNVEQFLDSLSMGTISFLLDETFFRADTEPVFQESNNIPERIDITVFDKPRGEVRTINTSNPKGKIIFLGLGTAEYAVGVVPPSSADSSNNSSIGNNQENTVNSEDNTTYIVIAILIVAVIGIIFYIIKSPNKS